MVASVPGSHRFFWERAWNRGYLDGELRHHLIIAVGVRYACEPGTHARANSTPVSLSGALTNIPLLSYQTLGSIFRGHMENFPEGFERTK